MADWGDSSKHIHSPQGQSTAEKFVTPDGKGWRHSEVTEFIGAKFSVGQTVQYWTGATVEVVKVPTAKRQEPTAKADGLEGNDKPTT